MSLDSTLLGRAFPPTAPHAVTEASIAAFSAATGGAPTEPTLAPPTYPIVLAFEAMQTFLDAEQLPLHRIVHGEQRFSHVRPVRSGDVLVARLEVSSLRSIGGNDLIGTTSTVTDADGEVVCTATATLVHRAEQSAEAAQEEQA